MLILALETATRAGSLAFWDDGEVQASTGDASRTHGERLPTEIVTFLERHGRALKEVDLLAVVSGPGSFTGLRVGIAAMQGIALASGRLVVPIPTVDAMLYGWRATAVPGTPEIVAPCLDGQRGDVFLAAFDTAAGDSGGAVTVIEARVAKPIEAAHVLSTIADGRTGVIVGDGGRRYAAVFAEGAPAFTIIETPMLLARAAVELAARGPDSAVHPHALRPIYLRRSDAEIARERIARPGEADDLSQFRIRRLEKTEDLAGVEVLQRQSFTNPWGAEAIRWELENTDVARLYVMDAPDGTLVAYCACWMVFGELHINSLAVDTAWRRRGLARRLLTELLQDSRRGGAHAATLEVRSSNAAARGLYEGLGFRVEGIRRDYYQDPREDALILWKRF